ncbi:DUF3592 domain-containing protein [Saccharopolyspora mangrovi]|uniref:DUF3592 domain-containing protein n=1 Tax=Saccharopolyspora mangrovi TaxID=3082379 RepID=A0ABU6A8F4_9PSEU|nr:DUF3592 domain-containing protein [Saccharopolyspora sp. S2-29]MEB3367842.1 DUF3592 domain-containing protein [Saccharopolyspora sp. S2-29]
MGTDEAWFYIGLGVVLVPHFPLVAVMLLRTRARHRGWTHVTGTVTSVKTRRQTNGETRTAVRYRYVDATGQQRSGTDTPWLRAPRRKSQIAVMYDPDNPERSEASSMTWLYVLLPISAVLLALGLWSVAAGLHGLTG